MRGREFPIPRRIISQETLEARSRHCGEKGLKLVWLAKHWWEKYESWTMALLQTA